MIDAASQRVREGAHTVRLSSEVLHEDATATLVAKGRNAFALVLGSRGLGDLAGMLLGSASLVVAARADCPVVVVRGTAAHREGPFGSVVVGVEEGEGSCTAVQFAFREAHVRHFRLVAVHAWSAPFGAFTTPQAPSPYALEAHRRPPAQMSPEYDRTGGDGPRRRWAPAGPEVVPAGTFGPVTGGRCRPMVGQVVKERTSDLLEAES
ncbi:universal stress protein [Streptomyces sp. NPDC007991]|uniref:universal stress protein n=1 Tax=Streptomyces sp. NPDC007991 TaxID=3364803 RepID=UPI0036E9C585